MELSEYVTLLRGELVSITQVAGSETARAAELVARSLEPSVRLTLLEVLSAAAAEITSRLEDTVVEVRLAGGEPSFVVQRAPDVRAPAPSAPADEGEDSGLARVTLRLPETLKARVEAAAADSGVSVNTWLVQAARRALEMPGGRTAPPPGHGLGQRITGFARS